MNLNIVPLIQSASIVCCTFMFVCMLPSAYARELFAWHPIFMTLGYIGFMCEGIIVSFKSRAIEGVTRAGVLTNHMWLQLTSAIMVGIGFAAIYVNKVRVCFSIDWHACCYNKVDIIKCMSSQYLFGGGSSHHVGTCWFMCRQSMARIILRLCMANLA